MGRQAGAQPVNLSTVVDLILRNVEPRPMRIDARCWRYGSLEPIVVACGESRESVSAHRCQIAEIVLQRVSSEDVASGCTQLERRHPLRVLLRREQSLLERKHMIRPFDDG